VQHCNMKNRHS